MEVRRDHINNEDTYFISSLNLVEDIKYIINHNIDNIGINSVKGYRDDNIREIGLKIGTIIRKLHVEKSYMDLKDIDLFPHITFLSVIDDNSNFDLSKNIEITKLLLANSKGVRGLDCLVNINSFSVSKADESIYVSIRCFTRLKKLYIVNPINFSFEKIINESSLIEYIDLSYCRNEVDISCLTPLKERLKVLRINNTRNLKGTHILHRFTRLETIVFRDCGPIDNCYFVNYLTNLKQITVAGKSYFIDGNIDKLLREGLTVGIDNKKHYSLKSNQFLNYFRNPPEPMP